jgi:aryl-alcohol dehydrogenase-like predicted oxidoreductase
LSPHSKLIIGGAQFGMLYGVSNSSGVFTDDQMAQMIAMAKSSNIKMIDTAYAYGDSESRLGKLNLDGCQLITKLPKFDSSHEARSFVDYYLNASLDRLNLKYIYGYLVHHSNDLLSDSGPLIYERLRFWQEAGKVKKIGISIHDFSVAKQIINRYSLDIVQMPFNVLDRRAIKDGFLQFLKVKGIEVHARSIFLQGLLLMSNENRPNYFMRWRSLLEEWQDWLKVRKLNATDACLQFVLRYPEVDNLVVGFDSLNQFSQINSQINDLSCDGDFFIKYSEDLDLINPSYWKLK